MTAGHSISVEPQFSHGGTYRWRCQCGRTGPWVEHRDRAVTGGSLHAAAERRRVVAP